MALTLGDALVGATACTSRRREVRIGRSPGYMIIPRFMYRFEPMPASLALHKQSSSHCETNSVLIVCFFGQSLGRTAMGEKRRTNRNQGDDGPLVTSLAALRSQEHICQRCP